MKNVVVFTLLSLAVLTMSCQKEDELTNGELIALELQSVIKENSLNRVMNFSLDQSWTNIWIPENFGRNYKFESEFIFIEGEVYNLNQLIKYRIAQKDGISYLLLTFY